MALKPMRHFASCQLAQAATLAMPRANVVSSVRFRGCSSGTRHAKSIVLTGFRRILFHRKTGLIDVCFGTERGIDPKMPQIFNRKLDDMGWRRLMASYFHGYCWLGFEV